MMSWTNLKMPTSIISMMKLVLIAVFVQQQLLLEERRYVVSARPLGIIYNKDGKFIYRPSRLHQGHIIVIDDNQKSKSSASSSSGKSSSATTDQQQQQPQMSASANSIYPAQIQLVGPNGAMFQAAHELAGQSAASPAAPLGGLLTAATAPGQAQFQFVDMNGLRVGQSLRPEKISRSSQASAPQAMASAAVRLVPMIQFYPALAAPAATMPMPTVSQAILAHPNRYNTLPTGAQFYVGAYGGSDNGLGLQQAAWQQAQLYPTRDQHSSHRQQQQHTLSLEGGQLGGVHERLDSLYAPRVIQEPEPGYSGHIPFTVAGPAHGSDQASEVSFLEDDVAQRMFSPSSRTRSRLTSNDLSNQDLGAELDSVDEGARDDYHSKIASHSGSALRTATSGSARGHLDKGSRKSIMSLKSVPLMIGSDANDHDSAEHRTIQATGAGKHYQNKRNLAHGGSRIHQHQHQQHQQHDLGGGAPSRHFHSPGSIRESSSQNGAIHPTQLIGQDDQLTNPDSRGAHYWKQYKDQFDVIH